MAFRSFIINRSSFSADVYTFYYFLLLNWEGYYFLYDGFYSNTLGLGWGLGESAYIHYLTPPCHEHAPLPVAVEYVPSLHIAPILIFYLYFIELYYNTKIFHIHNQSHTIKIVIIYYKNFINKYKNKFNKYSQYNPFNDVFISLNITVNHYTYGLDDMSIELKHFNNKCATNLTICPPWLK